MTQQSINFLIIVPELFQVILINVLLLFAICFAHYNVHSKATARTISPVTRCSIETYSYQNNKFRQLDSNSTSSWMWSQQHLDLGTRNEPKQQAAVNFSADVMIDSFGATAFRAPALPYGAYVITPVLKIEALSQLTLLSLIFCSILYVHNPISYALGLSDTVIIDRVGTVMSVLVCLSAAAALALGLGNIKRFSRYEFVLIIMLSIIGMLCLIKSNNLLTFYLCVELQSLSFYMLAAMRSRSEASAEAGLKYFILSAFSSAILLLGMTLIYAALGSQNFADINIAINHFISDASTDALMPQNGKPSCITFQQPVALTVGLGCISISLLFKLAAAPFHAWVADVYEGSPTAITALFAIVSKIAVLTVLIRICQINQSSELFTFISFVAAISLIVGSLSAMRQIKLKRLLAFSGVTNVGWFLCALIAGQWSCLTIHLVVYILLNILLFSIFIYPLFRTHPSLQYRHSRKVDPKHGLIDHAADSSTLKYITDLEQLNKTNPTLAFAIVIAAFSLVGIPPLAGFYSKYLILNALTQAEQYFVLAFALASAVVSAFYYIRVIKTMYFSTTKQMSTVTVPLKRASVPPQEQQVTYRTPGPGTDSLSATTAPSSEKHLKNWFSIDSAAAANAYLISISVILTVLFFVKPDYVCVWLALSY